MLQILRCIAGKGTLPFAFFVFFCLSANAQTIDQLFALPEQPLAVNTDVLLLYEGLTCQTNQHVLAPYTHYALCKTRKGFLLKNTTLTTYLKPNAPQYIGLRCLDTDSTLFIISTLRPLPIGNISGNYYDWTTGAIDYGTFAIADTQLNLVVETDDPDAPEAWQRAALSLIDRTAHRQQLLVGVTRVVNPTPEQIFTPPYTLHFCGDLDGDHKLDYIISGESNAAAEERLYLSSMARKGELVREVARWNYCLSND